MRKLLFGLAAAALLFIPQGTSLADDEPQFDIKVMSCAVTTLDITFHPVEGVKAPDMKVQAPKGCRCSFLINGLEFIPTSPMPDAFCGIGDPTDGVKKDKR